MTLCDRHSLLIERTGIAWPLWVIGVGLLALTCAGAFAQWRADHPMVAVLALGQVPLYLAAAWMVLAQIGIGSVPRAYVSIVLFGALLRLVLIAAPPVSSDVYRYVWDGRVQGAGINPYRYVPADDALRNLRDGDIYPSINRADYAPTIYPPAAQLVFLAVTRVSESVAAMKAVMVGFETLAILAIVKLLTQRGLPRSNILLYAWHPLPLWAFAGSGHVDIVGMALLMLAYVAADRRSPIAAGLALAAGTLVKLFPVVACPALYKRCGWRLPVAFAAGVVLLYLPYLGVRTKVFGFLGSYVAEEGFADGSGIFLWALLRAIAPLPQNAVLGYLAGAATILIVIALWFFLQRHREGRDTLEAAALIFALLVLISPHYPWYFCWLVPFLCLHPFAAGLYLTAVAMYLELAHWPPTLWEGAVIYWGALVVLLAEVLHRAQRRDASRERTTAA